MLITSSKVNEYLKYENEKLKIEDEIFNSLQLAKEASDLEHDALSNILIDNSLSYLLSNNINNTLVKNN